MFMITNVTVVITTIRTIYKHEDAMLGDVHCGV